MTTSCGRRQRSGGACLLAVVGCGWAVSLIGCASAPTHRNIASDPVSGGAQRPRDEWSSATTQVRPGTSVVLRARSLRSPDRPGWQLSAGFFELAGEVVDVDSDGVSLRLSGAEVRRVDKEVIERMDVVDPRGRSESDGIMIGLLVGAGIGAIGTTTLVNAHDFVPFVTILPILIGAAVGGAADYLYRPEHRYTVYEAGRP